MGNSNSASFNTRPPPKWTQSLPRDAHRNKRNPGLKQGPKVLPERIPGQRLRPTENGRILHFKGTITHRKLEESYSMPITTGSTPLSHQHSTSMTALNFSPEHTRGGNCPKHPSDYSPPRKIFTSEPDLREIDENQSYQHQPQPMIHETSTKGKIMSKKRHKAPAPPPVGERVDFNGYEAKISPRYEARALSPLPKMNKKGLFKKKNDSRPAIVYDHVNSTKYNEESYRKMHSSSPVEIDGRSNEFINSSGNPHFPHITSNNVRNFSQIRASSLEREPLNQMNNATDLATTLDRKPKSKHKTGLHGAYSFRDDEREISSTSRSYSNKYIEQSPPHPPTFHLRKTRDSESNMDAWDRAEQEYVEKKKNSEMFQQEIMDAAKNLKKTKHVEKEEKEIEPKEKEKQNSESKENQPKTFFFGMPPDTKDDQQPKENINNLELIERHNDKSNISTQSIVSSSSSTKKVYKEKREELHEIEEENHISQKIDEFVATIERTKQKLKPSKSELLSSISGDDGGYHSRQSSGSGHNESEKGDEITMKLRPTLPKRQLELPRFSPNAAWRSLGIETSHKSKETTSESLENQDLFQLNEDKIHRYSRQLPPSRGSGEKSADSGISGDAGSPGIGQEFEHSVLKKHEEFQGPLAVSSPMSSSKLNIKRAWTPAQDLDDNSFEDSGDHSSKSMPQDCSTFPKLTSRTNMFSQSMQRPHKSKNNTKYEPLRSHDYNGEIITSGNDIDPEGISVSYTTKIINKSNDDEDLWRENWSLSRSIPNSLNTDEPDRGSNSSHAFRSRSESRMSNNESKINQRPITPSYLQHGDTGHIMYLPEYKAYQMKKSNKMKENSVIDSSNIAYSKEGYMKSSSDLTKETSDDKRKKFAYKSTIRMLEKRWLEEKLSKEVKDEEDRRRKEMEEIMKVEQEFKNKREREKKKIKQQLKQYQSDEKPLPRYQSVINISNDSESYIIENGSIDQNHPSYNKIKENPTNISHFHSLQSEFTHNNIETASEPTGLFSGIKKWVKGKKDIRNGGEYASDASSTTLTSGSRQEPDGAPSTSNKKTSDNFRGEIIAASRSRNGSVSVGNHSNSPDFESDQNKYTAAVDFSSDVHSSTSVCTSEGSFEYKDSRYVSKQNQSVVGRRYMRKYSKSPAASESSRTSRSKRTISPDSRRSSSSDPNRVCHDISDSNEDRRQYKEYRQAMRKQLQGKSYKELETADNYRKNFAYGQPPQKGYMEEIDRYSRYSNNSRSSKKSSSSSKKNYSIDSSDNEKQRRSPFRQNYPYSYRSSSIDSSPARFVQGHLTPFGQQKAYRPVVYNSNRTNKVLVT